MQCVCVCVIVQERPEFDSTPGFTSSAFGFIAEEKCTFFVAMRDCQAVSVESPLIQAFL